MNHKFAIGLGILIWAVTFVVSIIIFPLRDNDRALFESIMPAVLTIITLIGSYLFYKRVSSRFIFQGWCLGLIWLSINLLLDLLMFVRGPIQMTLNEYIKDIGITYLIILAIPVGIGYILARRGAHPLASLEANEQ